MNPGATTMPRASMVRLAGSALQVSDGGDLARPDGDVAGIPRRPGAVDDAAVADDHVVGVGGGGEEEQRQKKGHGSKYSAPRRIMVPGDVSGRVDVFGGSAPGNDKMPQTGMPRQ